MLTPLTPSSFLPTGPLLYQHSVDRRPIAMEQSTLQTGLVDHGEQYPPSLPLKSQNYTPEIGSSGWPYRITPSDTACTFGMSRRLALLPSGSPLVASACTSASDACNKNSRTSRCLDCAFGRAEDGAYIERAVTPLVGTSPSASPSSSVVGFRRYECLRALVMWPWQLWRRSWFGLGILTSWLV